MNFKNQYYDEVINTSFIIIDVSNTRCISNQCIEINV